MVAVLSTAFRQATIQECRKHDRRTNESMKRASLFSLAFLLTVLSPGLPAQDYPARPIRVLVASGTGGGLDFVARLIAPRLGEYLGQSVVVDNRPGASGSIAVELTVNAAPDGYTLVFMSATSLVHSMLVKVPYDILRDLTPVSQVAAGPYVLLVNPALPVKSVAELIAYTKANPGKLNYASTGNGSLIHLATELLRSMTGTDMVHVPFKGTVPAIQSVLAGDTIVAFGTIPGVVPHAKVDKLALLGTSFAKRFPPIPDVPPIADQLPGFDMGFYTALWVPANTPREVVERLHAELTKAFAQPRVKEVFAASAAEQGNMTPAQLRDYMQSEVKAWGEVVRAIGLKAD